MNRERIAGLRVLAVALMLAIAVALILDLAGVKNVPAKVAAAIAAADATVLVNGTKEWIAGTLRQRADVAAERARYILMPGGKIPHVRDVTDPISVGVRPAAPRPQAARPSPRPGPGRGRGDRVPLYVRRDVDEMLRQALAASGFVLLVGDATAGKTRTAYEAMRAVLPGHLFIAPSDLDGVAAAVAAAAGLREAVLWLDDLPLFLGPGGLTRKAIAELMDGPGHHRVILATIRATDESRITAGGAGPDERLVRTGQDVVDQAGHRIFVERLFTPRELERTRALARRDSRLADVVRHAAGGAGEYLAAGPQLYAAWQDAWARGHHPRGAALVAAAVDCRRAGFAGPLPRLLLIELHPAYLELHGGSRAYPESLEQAWAWAVSPRESGSAPLRYTDADHCDVFGYLTEEYQRREGTPAPESIARTALSYAGPGDASMIANAAWRQGRYELAETAIREVYEAVRQTSGAADPEALAVRNNLGVILQTRGKPAEAEAEYRAILAASGPGAVPAGARAARRNLAVILYDQGRLTEAEAEYRAILETRGEDRDPAGQGTLAARNNLAGILHAQGRLADAEAEYLAVRQARVDTLGPDHPDTLTTRNNYAVVLKDLGRLDAAEEEFRQVLTARIRVLGPAHPHTTISRDNLASLTREHPAGLRAAVRPVRRALRHLRHDPAELELDGGVGRGAAERRVQLGERVGQPPAIAERPADGGQGTHHGEPVADDFEQGGGRLVALFGLVEVPALEADVAEQRVRLGVPPQGRVRCVAERLPGVPLGQAQLPGDQGPFRGGEVVGRIFRRGIGVLGLPDRLDEPVAEQLVPPRPAGPPGLRPEQVPVLQRPRHRSGLARGPVRLLLGRAAAADLGDERVDQPEPQPPHRDLVNGGDRGDGLAAVAGQRGVHVAAPPHLAHRDGAGALAPQQAPQPGAGHLEQRRLDVVADHDPVVAVRSDDPARPDAADELAGRPGLEVPVPGRRLAGLGDPERAELEHHARADHLGHPRQAVLADRHQQVQALLLAQRGRELVQETPPVPLALLGPREQVVGLVDRGQDRDARIPAPRVLPHEIVHREAGQVGRGLSARPGPEQRQGERVVHPERRDRGPGAAGQAADREQADLPVFDQRQHAGGQQRGLADPGRPGQERDGVVPPHLAQARRFGRAAKEPAAVRTLEGPRARVSAIGASCHVRPIRGYRGPAGGLKPSRPAHVDIQRW
jgi:tetratricopeptide (TPR) repeat protein